VLLCRSDRNLSREIKQKDCRLLQRRGARRDWRKNRALHLRGAALLALEGVDALILKYLHKEAPEADLTEWKALVERCYNPNDEVSIAIVGKYVEYEDSYKSLKEALTHGAVSQNLKLKVYMD